MQHVAKYNHDERRQRRMRMAQMVAEGASDRSVASEFSVSLATVANACREFGSKLSHEDRRKRREAMADMVRAGERCANVAIKFGVSLGTVLKSCQTHGVKLRRGCPQGTLRPSACVVLPEEWDKVDWSARDVDIALQFGVSRERVRQIRKKRCQPQSIEHRHHKTTIATLRWMAQNRDQIAGMFLTDIVELLPFKSSYAAVKVASEKLKLDVKTRSKWSVTKENLECFVTKVIRRADLGECWEWDLKTYPSGYARLGGKTRYGHRHVYQIFNGPIPNGLWCLHRCDNPKCVNPSHLYVGTAKDNARDREEAGHGQQGERCHFSVLNEEQVTKIRRTHATGTRSMKSLADEYHVTVSAIYGIVRGRTWKHLGAPNMRIAGLESEVA